MIECLDRLTIHEAGRLNDTVQRMIWMRRSATFGGSLLKQILPEVEIFLQPTFLPWVHDFKKEPEGNTIFRTG